MIYSVTLNPSIDFIVRVKDFQIGETNRAYEDNFFAGGKGIMVSKLLKKCRDRMCKSRFFRRLHRSIYWEKS